ncbi:hypothetical protein KAR91_09325 [Candidatus Pacearchaeota archaeon]|nr:hypothetical protein [Candidatus Pacearchaeota archaeon]
MTNLFQRRTQPGSCIIALQTQSVQLPRGDWIDKNKELKMHLEGMCDDTISEAIPASNSKRLHTVTIRITVKEWK